MALYKRCAVAMETALFPQLVCIAYSSLCERDFVSRVFVVVVVVVSLRTWERPWVNL